MQKMVFVLSRDEHEAATRCFLFAKIAHEGGHDVNVFLIDGGVHWADSSRDGRQRCETGDCVSDHLPYLVENNIPTGVCLPCAKGRNLSEDAFYPNMRLAKGKELIEMCAVGSTFNF
ncbi:DsrE family protein [Salidesulfovibrio brasiliensis]|uniref:DsrE family protein n=1 Tax=Salidesulfovibrio brasiliensis TaxID=221711 RepID=UPI0006D25DDA|nr:DsrE family protein [Salidesulfovibrio brasiliensis]